MTEDTKKNMLKIQKLAIGFCTLVMLLGVSVATVAKHNKDNKSRTFGTAGAILGGLGLGMTAAGYLSNPYRKKRGERD